MIRTADANDSQLRELLSCNYYVHLGSYSAHDYIPVMKRINFLLSFGISPSKMVFKIGKKKKKKQEIDPIH